MSEGRPVRRRRMLPAKIMLALTVALATYAVVEFSYRLSIYRKHVDAGYGITIVNADIHAATTGYLAPNLDFHWRQFNAEHKLMCDAHVKTNAQGFISAKDYPLPKPPREFRIALIGDSFTACITNDFPWADVLDDELNRDEQFKSRVHADAIRVLNIGTPGAGFHFFASNYVRFAERFAPDLVIVNYIEEDFPREGNSNLLSNLDAIRDAPAPRTDYVQVQQARLRVLGNYSDELAREYGDPLRIPGLALSQFFVIEDDELAMDKAQMDSIKRELAERYFRPRLWRSLRPHALYRVLGAKFQLEGPTWPFGARAATEGSTWPTPLTDWRHSAEKPAAIGPAQSRLHRSDGQARGSLHRCFAGGSA